MLTVPTVCGRLLAWKLVALRQRASLSKAEVAARVGVSESMIYRIEAPITLPKEGVLRRMIAVYSAEDEAGELLELRRQAKIPGWWVNYKDVIGGPYIELEGAADLICSYQAKTVPGLLQTEGYAQAILDAVHGTADPESNARRLALRVERRRRFAARHNTQRLHVVLDEAVVRRRVGGAEVMRDQISYLKAVADRPNITIQVIPYEVGGHVGMAGSFVIMEFAEPEFPDVLYVETRAGDLYPEGERTVLSFRADWRELIKVALTPTESVEKLTDIIKELI